MHTERSKINSCNLIHLQRSLHVRENGATLVQRFSAQHFTIFKVEGFARNRQQRKGRERNPVRTETPSPLWLALLIYSAKKQCPITNHRQVARANTCPTPDSGPPPHIPRNPLRKDLPRHDARIRSRRYSAAISASSESRPHPHRQTYSADRP